MIYIGIVLGGHRNIFICSSRNVVFTAAHTEFIENCFPAVLWEIDSNEDY